MIFHTEICLSVWPGPAVLSPSTYKPLMTRWRLERNQSVIQSVSLASLVVYMWERTGRADQHCESWVVTLQLILVNTETSHLSQSDPAMADIVKSSYVVDPEDQMRLVRRDEVGTEIDREYWDRVNQERIFSVFYLTVITVIILKILFWKHENPSSTFRVKMFWMPPKCLSKTTRVRRIFGGSQSGPELIILFFKPQRVIYCSDKLRVKW